jgi:hypothetical protein
MQGQFESVQGIGGSGEISVEDHLADLPCGSAVLVQPDVELEEPSAKVVLCGQESATWPVTTVP